MSARSATEVSAKLSELASNMGSAFGRLITETMIPVVSRILAVMDERGLIDMPLKVNGLEIKVQPVSPIAQAQNMSGIEKVMQWVQIAASLGQDGQMAIRTAAIADHVADKMGIPAELRTSQEERQQMAEQMAQMQAAQMAMQAGEVAGE